MYGIQTSQTNFSVHHLKTQSAPKDSLISLCPFRNNHFSSEQKHCLAIIALSTFFSFLLWLEKLPPNAIVMMQEAPGRLSSPQSGRSAVNTAALLLICIWAYRPSELHSEHREREREREGERDHGLELSANGSGGEGEWELNCK